jgi:hypothetical protein
MNKPPIVTASLSSIRHYIFLCHGRDPRTPVDVLSPAIIPIYESGKTYKAELIRALRRAAQVVAAHRRSEYDYLSSRPPNATFPVGMAVLMYQPPVTTLSARNERKTAKLTRPWTGPYRITDIPSASIRTLTDSRGITHPNIHISRLKPYYHRPDAFLDH